MRIVVIGCGKVGREIIQQLSSEQHEIVAIDTLESEVNSVVEKYDVLGLTGNGTSYETLKNANVSKADVVIAVTPSDDTNILACLIAKKLGTKHIIARVRDYEYSHQVSWMKEELGLSLIINPEYEAAEEIKNIINFPEALRVDRLAGGKVDLVELYIPDDSKMVNKSLIDIKNEYSIQVLVCAVERDEEVIIPNGTFTFNAHDKVYITASRATIRSFLKKLGLIEEKIKDVLIVGGGIISVYLAEVLSKMKCSVKIIEQDYNRCIELSELLPNVTIVNGNGTSKELLEEEGIKNCDCIVTLTGIDEENIIVSMYASKLDVPKVITKVNTSAFVSILDTIGESSIISPKEITSNKIIGYVRGINEFKDSDFESISKLVSNKVEVLEFTANAASKSINKPLSQLKLINNTLVCAIIHDNEAIIPTGSSIISESDKVIVVSYGHIINSLDDILE